MKKIQRKHEAHRLTYAIANDGCLVNIDTVKAGQECCCICPACKEPLVAKNKGTVRVHHHDGKTPTRSVGKHLRHVEKALARGRRKRARARG